MSFFLSTLAQDIPHQEKHYQKIDHRYLTLKNIGVAAGSLLVASCITNAGIIIASHLGCKWAKNIDQQLQLSEIFLNKIKK